MTSAFSFEMESGSQRRVLQPLHVHAPDDLLGNDDALVIFHKRTVILLGKAEEDLMLWHTSS